MFCAVIYIYITSIGTFNRPPEKDRTSCSHYYNWRCVCLSVLSVCLSVGVS